MEGWTHDRLKAKNIPAMDKWLYQGYTNAMKTAISLPDALYADAEKTARSMGIPRSRLFAMALEEFIHYHKRESITEQLNMVYEGTDNSDYAGISTASLNSLREFTKDDAW